MVTKSSPFDLDFSKEYRLLRKQKEEVQHQIDPLLADDKGNSQQIHALITEREKYGNAIIKLLQKETQKHSPQYAKQMFDMSADIIKKHLSDDAVRFDLLSAQQKLKFGQKFIDHIAKRLNIIPNKLVLKDDMPQDKGAEYTFNTGDIDINQNYVGNMQDFIGMILHEFTHHLYVRYPDLSPLGEQKVVAVMENFISDFPDGVRSAQELAAYRQRPFESIAYDVQDFFKENKFGEHVLLQIVEQQTVFEKTLKNR